MKLILSCGLVVLIFGGCIQPFNIHVQSSAPSIVVDGLITDEPGPYTVKMYSTSSFNDQLDKTNWVTGASVLIFDDQGTQETLKELTPGHYQTTAIQGTIGKTYHITITTAEGHAYISQPEKLLPVGDITKIAYEFVQTENPPSKNPLSSSNGFNIYLDGNVLPEQNDLVRWRWNGTYEVQTFPQNKTKVKPLRGPVLINPTLIPDPPGCSGYILDKNDSSKIVLVASCSCCICWVEQYNQSPLLSDKRFISDNAIHRFNVAFIPVNRRTFYDKYYLEIEQLSISQNVYDFWKRVAQQNSTGNDLFQTPPPHSTGNIQSVVTGDIPILGVFGAAAVKKQSITLLPNELPYELKPIDTLAESCLLEYQNSSNLKPSFW